MVTSKKCSQCGIVKPAERFFKTKHKKSGLVCQCKDCCSLKHPKKPPNPLRPNWRTTGLKWCPKCGEIKPATDFYKTTGRTGIQGRCKPCSKKQTKEWYKSHPGMDYAKVQRWQRNNPEARSLQAKRHYTAHREEIRQRHKRWYAENREQVKKTAKKWRDKHPELVIVKVWKRRARLAGAEGAHTYDEWKAIVRKFRGRCVCCGEYFGIRKLTKDHVIPLTKGGSDNASNLQPLCQQCNASKCNHHTADYRQTPFTRTAQLALLG